MLYQPQLAFEVSFDYWPAFDTQFWFLGIHGLTCMAILGCSDVYEPVPQRGTFDTKFNQTKHFRCCTV